MQLEQTFRYWWTRRRQRQALVCVVLGLMGGLAIAALQYLAHDAPLMSLGWPGWLTLLVTALAFVLNAITALPAEIVFLGAVAVLYVSGVLSTTEALKGFSNDGMITVAVLYFVVTGLQQTGALAWVSQQVLGLPKRRTTTFVRLTVPIMVLSAFLNNTPVVAMFIPVVNDWCRKLRISPFKVDDSPQLCIDFWRSVYLNWHQYQFGRQRLVGRSDRPSWLTHF
jgi:di/tricarboxylate transporter